MVAARSYGEMVSFGNAQIASSLSGMGTNSTNKLCRLGSDGKMICDISTGLSSSNTANRFCRTDASGTLQCSTDATTCGTGQASKWNGSSFECVAFGITGTPNRLCRINGSGVFSCDTPSYIGEPNNMWRGANCTFDYDGFLKCVMCPSGQTATWDPSYNATVCAPNGSPPPPPPAPAPAPAPVCSSWGITWTGDSKTSYGGSGSWSDSCQHGRPANTRKDGCGDWRTNLGLDRRQGCMNNGCYGQQFSSYACCIAAGVGGC